MNVVMIGAGYVGLVSAACFAEFGFSVTCVDVMADKIAQLKQGKVPIYEPGLDDLIVKNQEAGRLGFTTDLASAVARADVVFIAVGTPRRNDGHADLRYVEEAARQIADALDGYTVVVNKSTVPVGTGRLVADIIRGQRADARFDVVSNPEFLREGSAIEDFMRPDRVVIGSESERARDVMRRLYRVLYLIETPIVETNLETAELAKYATNAFLATKVTFINEMSDLCDAVGADVQEIAKAMGLDKRIGPKFLHAGPGYGGSCFPKDTRALASIAVDQGAPTQIVEAVVRANDSRKAGLAARVTAAAGGSIEGAVVAVLGLAFKPNTDDMREAPAIDLIAGLTRAGATVRAYDPEAMVQARELIDGAEWCDDAAAAYTGADILVVATEWNEFRAISPEALRGAMRGDLVVDLRNIFDPAALEPYNFRYYGVGRGRTNTVSLSAPAKPDLVAAK